MRSSLTSYTMPRNIFGGINFATIANDPNFKEDSVREEIVMPILKRLGYKRENIVRSKPLFAQFGTKKREMAVPDYTLTIGQHNAFILDAKAPNQVITEGKNVEQALSYAMHNEVRSEYFALCNGLPTLALTGKSDKIVCGLKSQCNNDESTFLRRQFRGFTTAH